MNQIKTNSFPDFSAYQIGSPVKVNGKITHITRLPEENQSMTGYLVSENGYIIPEEEIQPIPIDETVFRYYSGFRQDDGALVVKGKGHVVVLNRGNLCMIDGEEYGKVDALHEFKNILHTVCDIDLPQYHPLPENHDR